MTDDDQDDNTPRERPATNSERIDLLQRLRTLEENDEQQRLDIASLLASRRSWRVIAGVGIPAVLTAAVAVMLWSVDRVSASSERTGETKAKIEAHDKLFELLEKGIDQLRQRTGLNSAPSSDIWTLPDKLSLLPHKDPHAFVSHP